MKTTLKDICEVVKIKSLSNADLKKIEDTTGTVELLSPGKFRSKTTLEKAGVFLNKGEVIAIATGGSFNIKYCQGHYVSSYNYIITGKEGMKTKYLYYLLCHKAKKIQSLYYGWGCQRLSLSDFLNLKIEFAEENQSGSSHPAISDSKVKDYSIPIPPIPVQQEIVRILDAFSQLTEELTKELTARKKQYSYYRDKLLTFKEGEVEWKALGEVFDLRNGYTPSKAKSEYWNNGSIPWFRMEDLRSNGGILNKAIQNCHKDGVKGKLFRANSIIMATTATIGEHALITVDYLCNQRFTNFTLKDEFCKLLDIKFVYYYFFILDEKAKQSVNLSSFPSVQMNELRKWEIPIPPISRQKEIVEILDKFDTLTNSISEGLPREVELRKKQYEYYRNELLNFEL